MSDRRLTPLDAVWLLMESRDTPMHVGALAIFRKPSGAPADHLRRWLRSLRADSTVVAPWNQRLEGGAVLGPRLVPDADFDLDYHLRHTTLPEPGGERELGVVVSRLHSMALQRQRPLWEFHVIDGLARNRFAVYLKVHHALVDNINCMPLVFGWLAATARERNLAPPWARPMEPRRAAHQAQPFSPVTAASGTAAAVGQVTAEFVSDTLRDGLRSLVRPFGTPRSTLNRRINSQRRFATWQFKQARIKALADATDSSLNDILAYLCGSALRRFFKEYNALPERPLVGSLPVSLAERSPSAPGNAIAGLRVALGTHIGDPLVRLSAIKSSLDEVRRDQQALPAEATTPYVLLRSAPAYASQMPLVGALVPPLYNLNVSNTPGPARPRYLDGARLDAIYPLSPLMQFSALSIDCVGYAGTLNIGFTGARDTLPHLQRLAVYAGKAVEELEQLVATSA